MAELDYNYQLQGKPPCASVIHCNNKLQCHGFSKIITILMLLKFY